MYTADENTVTISGGTINGHVNGTANVDGAKVGVMAQGRLKNLTIDDESIPDFV